MRLAPTSHTKSLVQSFLIGALAFGLGWFLDRLLQTYGVDRFNALVDNLAGSVIVGLLVLYYEERRRRGLMERLQTIALMNHHVRNALQAITYSPYSPDRDQQLQIVSESIQRIDWALKEILPGKPGDETRQ